MADLQPIREGVNEHVPVVAPKMNGGGTGSGTGGSTRRDSANWVYEHWITVTDEQVDGGKKVVQYTCKYCNRAQYRHNVTRMRNHLINCEKAPEQAKQEAMKKQQSIADRKAKKANDPKAGKIEGKRGEAGPSSRKRKHMNGYVDFSKEEADRAFSHMYYALKLKEEDLYSKELATFIKTLNPSYKIPSSDAIVAITQTIAAVQQATVQQTVQQTADANKIMHVEQPLHDVGVISPMGGPLPDAQNGA